MTDVMDDARRIKRGFWILSIPMAVSRPRKRRLVRWRATCSSISTRMICRTVVTARLNASPPATLKDWREIPPMPVDGFKHLDLSTIPTEQCKAVFMTSGTTHGGKMRGRNFHPDLEVWDESMIVPFRHFIMPDRERIRIAVISPAWDMNQNSSLSRYLTKAVECCGSEGSGVFFDEHGLKFDEIIAFLNRAVSDGEPVMLMGVSSSYLYLFDYLHEHDLTFALAPDSRLFDTGGFKSTKRDITEDQMLDELEQTLGVPRHHCVNMYGMTELSSQIYDQNILSWYTDGTSNYLKANPPGCARSSSIRKR